MPLVADPRLPVRELGDNNLTPYPFVVVVDSYNGQGSLTRRSHNYTKLELAMVKAQASLNQPRTRRVQILCVLSDIRTNNVRTDTVVQPDRR